MSIYQSIETKVRVKDLLFFLAFILNFNKGNQDWSFFFLFFFFTKEIPYPWKIIWRGNTIIVSNMISIVSKYSFTLHHVHPLVPTTWASSPILAFSILLDYTSNLEPRETLQVLDCFSKEKDNMLRHQVWGSPTSIDKVGASSLFQPL
jgi:hypothetical protein